MCLDSKCFDGKREAHLVQIQVKAKEPGKPLVRVSSNYLGSPEQRKKGGRTFESRLHGTSTKGQTRQEVRPPRGRHHDRRSVRLHR
jgi:hypothetical protein